MFSSPERSVSERGCTLNVRCRLPSTIYRPAGAARAFCRRAFLLDERVLTLPLNGGERVEVGFEPGRIGARARRRPPQDRRHGRRGGGSVAVGRRGGSISPQGRSG